MSAPTDLSNEERVRYWASRSPSERMAAGWLMTVAHYKALGRYVEGQPLDKTHVRLVSMKEAAGENDT